LNKQHRETKRNPYIHQDSLVKAAILWNVIMGETANVIVVGKSLQAEVLQIIPDPKNADAGL